MRLTIAPRRRILDATFLALIGGAALFALLIVVGVIGSVAAQGAPALSWRFLSDEVRDGGGAGGIAYQILGTFILAATAALIAMPLGLAVALFQSEYLRGAGLRIVLGLLYLLSGVPSIVFGLLGYFALVRAAGLEKSWLGGGLVLAFMILPTIAISVIEAIGRIPRADREAALALGLNPPKVIWGLVLPASLPGLATGTLLGIARAAGETAPILFTAAVFDGVGRPEGIVDSPVVALSYHILVLAFDATSPAMLQNAWGAALVLLGICLVFSALAYTVRTRGFAEDCRA